MKIDSGILMGVILVVVGVLLIVAAQYNPTAGIFGAGTAFLGLYKIVIASGTPDES